MGNFDKALDEDYQNQPVMPAIPPERPVAVIDLGPQLPDAVPQRPEPTAVPARWLDFEEDTAHFVALVLKFRRERAEFVQKHGNGPVTLDTDPVSAREMVERGDGRYILK